MKIKVSTLLDKVVKQWNFMCFCLESVHTSLLSWEVLKKSSWYPWGKIHIFYICCWISVTKCNTNYCSSSFSSRSQGKIRFAVTNLDTLWVWWSWKSFMIWAKSGSKECDHSFHHNCFTGIHRKVNYSSCYSVCVCVCVSVYLQLYILAFGLARWGESFVKPCSNVFGTYTCTLCFLNWDHSLPWKIDIMCHCKPAN